MKFFVFEAPSHESYPGTSCLICSFTETQKRYIRRVKSHVFLYVYTVYFICVLCTLLCVLCMIVVYRWRKKNRPREKLKRHKL